jgi:hypothetical protein
MRLDSIRRAVWAAAGAELGLVADLARVPTRHAVLDGRKASSHVLLVPLQLSGVSQTPAAARHTAVLLASAGLTFVVPSQHSARSHAPAAARQTAVFGLTASGGQFGPEPLQVSALSHAPAAARHTPPVAKPSGGQTPALHVSATSQGPAAGRQGLPFGSFAVQLSRVSLHDSAQFVSPSGPGHGLPEWTLHVPPPHVSVPLQKSPSLHATLLFVC